MALKRRRASTLGRPTAAETARALTAATANIPLGVQGAWSSWKYGNRDWQIEAWRLYDIIPELRFLAGWIGDSVSQARLYVTKIDETGEETGEVEDAEIAKLAAVPLGTGSQRDDNLRLFGIDLAVGGEAWIVGEGAATSDPENWYVLSGSQISRSGDTVNVKRPMTIGGGVFELQDGADVLIRAWRPHPNDIYQSDSPTRSAIPPLREIELLTKREFAELESRLTGAGVWFLPEGVDFPRGEGDPEGATGFMAYLQRAMGENIRDQSRAAALVPIMASVPDHMLENLDKIKPINFWSDLSDQILPMKEKAIIRVAASFEIPSELLTGLGDSNHWSAWAVSEEGIKRIRPYLACMADTLTRGFLIPALERAGVAEADRYAYAFDTAPLAVRPNRLPEALELWDRGLLSGTEAVKAGAFSATQMPEGSERIIELVYKAVSQAPMLLTDPSIQQLIGLGHATPAAIEPPPVAPAPAEPASPADNSPPPEESTPPVDEAPPQASVHRALQASATSSQERLFLACKMMVLRSLEVAGGRLTTPADRRGRWADFPRHELHTRVGPVTPDRADRVLIGAWAMADTIGSAHLGCEPDVVAAHLQAHARELLCRGLAYQDDLLEPVVALIAGRAE